VRVPGSGVDVVRLCNRGIIVVMRMSNNGVIVVRVCNRGVVSMRMRFCRPLGVPDLAKNQLEFGRVGNICDNTSLHANDVPIYGATWERQVVGVVRVIGRRVIASVEQCPPGHAGSALY
jgi:hypothetical protein